MTTILSAHAISPERTTVRHVHYAASGNWITDALDDLRRAPLASLFYGVLMAVMGYLLVELVSGHFHHGVMVATGFLMFGSLLAMGLYDISRQIERGEAVDLVGSMVCWRGNFAAIITFGLIVGVALFAVAGLNNLLYAWTVGADPANLPDTAAQILAWPAGQKYVLMLLPLMLLALAGMFVVSLITVPVMLDRRLDPLSAMALSVRAVRTNPLACALWALFIVVFCIFGFATFCIGLALTMPLLGYASWHAYRDLIGDAREHATLDVHAG